MLCAYMDASGSHEGAETCLVAGYWAGPKVWRRFERDWQNVLTEAGVPEFHAKEFWQRQPLTGKRYGQYAKWDDVRHRDLIDRLLRVIQHHKIIPFGVGVDTSQWKSESAYYRKIFSGYHQHAPVQDSALKAIYLAFQVAVTKTTAYCSDGTKMDFCFDNDPNRSRIAYCFQSLTSHPEDKNDPILRKLGKLQFVDSKNAAGIQAADLLAYELYRYSKKRGRPRAEMIRALVRFKALDDFWFFDAPRFANLKRVLEITAVPATY